MGTTSVDPDALRFAAQRLDQAADLLGAAIREHLSGLRLHGADPLARTAVGELVDDVAGWQRAVREYAVAVRASADRYVDEDRRNAEVFG